MSDGGGEEWRDGGKNGSGWRYSRDNEHADFNEGRQEDIAVAHVLPKTGAWSYMDYQKLVDDSIGCLLRVISKNESTILMRGFSCKEVYWEDLNTDRKVKLILRVPLMRLTHSNRIAIV